ncbi:hypothetical protein ACMD2_08847 [Ananas comosus]|uniref:Uncharacterized protein n=1 Tax=Ananas comosus TaxID=4615 RepID=A0A199VEB7_ANACO|nr:hypothetical protein ACMD2_08847 [Ananas comosus]
MATSDACATIQHVSRASSEELLRKFADPDAGERESGSEFDRAVASLRGDLRALLRAAPAVAALHRKRSSRRVASGLSARPDALPSAKRRRSCGGAEWRAGLLLPASSRKQAPLLRRIGILRSDDATWRKTVAGASKMFVEKHCSNHVRLISDMV